MGDNTKSPFDKEPAEGSRDIVERELENQERKDKRDRPPDGAADRAPGKENRD